MKKKKFDDKSKAAACGYFVVAAIATEIPLDKAVEAYKVMKLFLSMYSIDEAASLGSFFEGGDPNQFD